MTRFCTSCMVDAGLDPKRSRLALPGCRSARLAYCDGARHDCVVTVDESGAIVTPRARDEFELPALVAGHSLFGG